MLFRYFTWTLHTFFKWFWHICELCVVSSERARATPTKIIIKNMVLTGYAIYNVLCMRLDWYSIEDMARIARHDAMTRYCVPCCSKERKTEREFVSNKILCVWALTGMECIYLSCVFACTFIRRHFASLKIIRLILSISYMVYSKIVSTTDARFHATDLSFNATNFPPFWIPWLLIISFQLLLKRLISIRSFDPWSH